MKAIDLKGVALLRLNSKAKRASLVFWVVWSGFFLKADELSC